jgi:hypothetical protein
VSLCFHIFPEFGRFCANGENAAAFRFSRIEPFLDSHDKIVLDFAGVHNVNSSFANALVANLISQHSEAVKRCNSPIATRLYGLPSNPPSRSAWSAYATAKLPPDSPSRPRDCTVSTAELIFEKARSLPSDKQDEALRFVDFLLARHSAEAEAAAWRKLLCETQSSPGVSAITDDDIAREAAA